MTSYLTLYRKYRPSRFADIVGQDHVVRALKGAIESGRVAHAYLFSGPRGTGKTTTARILARALNCENRRDGEPCGECGSCVEIAAGTSLQVQELDAASNNGVDAMRDLVARAALAAPGRYKVYIIDEVHMLSTAASNALLKTLEEPPPQVIFVLATTDPQKVLPTVRSRCQHLEFRLLSEDELFSLLSTVVEAEGLRVSEEVLSDVVMRANGSARDALTALEAAVSAGADAGSRIEYVRALGEALAEKDAAQVLKALERAVRSGQDPAALASDLVGVLRSAFFLIQAPDTVSEADPFRDLARDLAESLGIQRVVALMERLGEVMLGINSSPDPRIVVEASLLRFVVEEDALCALEARVAELEARLARQESSGDPRQEVRAVMPAGEPKAAPGAALGAFKRKAPEEVKKKEVVKEARPAQGAASNEDSSDRSLGREEIVIAFADRVKERLPQRVRSLYCRGRFTRAEGAVVEMAFPAGAPLNEVRAYKELVEKAFLEVLGVPIKLEFVAEEGISVPAPAISTLSPEVIETKRRLEEVFGPVELIAGSDEGTAGGA